MTVGAAWISGSAQSRQLWFASDSRLSGDEYIWDDCPKIMPLPRRDAIAAFSGDTAQAYPLLLQLSNAIGSYHAAADGTMDFLHVLTHLQNVVNSMMSHVYVDPLVSGPPTAKRPFSTFGDTLILGGYSRQRNSLVIRVLHYQAAESQWRFERVRARIGLGGQRIIATFGDSKARNRFVYLLCQRLKHDGIYDRDVPLKLEPLEVIASMLRMRQCRTDHRWPMDRRPSSIGGAPQVMQLYPGGQATSLAVNWETSDRAGIFIMGREVFSSEHLNVPLVTWDHQTARIYPRDNWPADIRRLGD